MVFGSYLEGSHTTCDYKVVWFLTQLYSHKVVLCHMLSLTWR